MIHNEIEEIVLSKITPSKDDKNKLEETIKEATKKIREELDNRDINAEIELVGSTAKDTYLKNNLDIDIFLVYPRNLKREIIAEYTLSIGRKILTDTEECYAEHPYIRGYFKDFKIEIVPCYKIEDASQKKSAVDRTPLHTRFIKSNLKEYQKQEVRLLKQFLRGIGCYGAEAEIQGFSGYLCELLIIKYDNFRSLLTKVKDWSYGETIKFYDDKTPSFDTPLIVIDPVDKDRNVAAAVSLEKFNLFIIASKEYLEKPRITFFFPKPVKPWSLEEIEKKMYSSKYIGIKFRKPDILSENLYPQIRKTMKSIKKYSEKQGFKIYDIRFHVDKKYIYIIVKTDIQPLSETYIQQGPPVNKKINVQQFIEKWRKHPLAVDQPYEENNRLYVEVKRKYRELTFFLRENLLKMPLGKNIEKIIKEEYEILEDEELLLEELKIFWTEYFEQKYPWER